MSRIALIVNPRSGKGTATNAAGIVAMRMREHGVDVTVHVGSSAEQTTQFTREAICDGVTTVAVCGGDGTINCALQEIVGSGVAMAIIPVGTGDDNARLLNVPRGNLEKAADLAVGEAIRTVDVGRVTSADGKERFFLGVLSTGFDSNVNETANAMRRFSGTTKYLAALASQLRDFPAIEYVVESDPVTKSGPALLVSVGNGRSYGGGMQVCATADPADGLLDVVWLDRLPRRTFLRVFPRVFRGTHLSHPAVQTWRTTLVSISAPGQIAYADGERVGPLPIEVRVVPDALRVKAPVV